MTVPQDFITLFSLPLWMAEICIIKMSNTFFLKLIIPSTKVDCLGEWLSWVWKDDLEFSKGQRAEQTSFWRNQKYLYLTPNSTYIQKRCPYLMPQLSLGYLVTASKSTTLFQVRTECEGWTAPLKDLQEAPVSPSEDKKTINLFQLGFAWQSSLKASWVISGTEPSFLLSNPRNTPQPPWQCLADPWPWHYRI